MLSSCTLCDLEDPKRFFMFEKIKKNPTALIGSVVQD